METRKKSVRESLPKTALARLYFIDEQIASGKYPNTQYLISKWEGISASTIGRDIAFMKDQLNAPIAYDALRRGYYYSKLNYRIPMGFSGADELLALAMAKNIFSLYRDTPVYNAARQLLDSIVAPLAAGTHSCWYETRIAIPQTPTAVVIPELWNTITTALKENQKLSFEYMGTYDEEYKPRRVRPYQLLFDTGVWYLFGFAEERKATRIFSLARMKNLVLLDDRFTLPKDFDYCTNNSESFFGIFAGQEKYQFKIAFYDYSVTWVQDRQWADDQKIVESGNGIIISFTSTQFEKVLEWVLSRGSTARPLEPESLVNVWREEIETMHKMARKNI